MNQYRMFYVQTSTLPPRMHHKLTKHGRFCKQNNQLPTKTHVELKDNSNNRLKFIRTAGKLPITLEEFMEYTSNSNRKTDRRMSTCDLPVGTCKHSDLNRLYMPRKLPDRCTKYNIGECTTGEAEWVLSLTFYWVSVLSRDTLNDACRVRISSSRSKNLEKGASEGCPYIKGIHLSRVLVE
jgi:hypothetical protein